MKRYRVFVFDIDTRASWVKLQINDDWEENVKAFHRENQQRLIQSLIEEYGNLGIAQKIQNLSELGDYPLSIVAFHNKFLHQIRTAFVSGAFYPALTGTCALGERILNHLLLRLRDEFSTKANYKKVFDKESFDNWELPIEVLESWDVLLPEVAKNFRKLAKVRNKAIHFTPETDTNDRQLALDAVRILNEIIGVQFASFGSQPWFIPDIPAESYIKKEAEEQPFIRKIYLPNCALVGPYHTIEYDKELTPHIHDDYPYEHREISDTEFAKLIKLQRDSS